MNPACCCQLLEHVAHRWRIAKACVILTILTALAVVQEQHARTMTLTETLINGVPPHVARERLSAMGGDCIAQNAPLMLCLLVGLPYVVYTIVMYILNKPDDIRNADQTGQKL